MKKVLILGAGGNIAQFVEQELADKADLTLYLRSPRKLAKQYGTVVTGDVFDHEQLVKTMKGQDIIFSNLGWQHMADMATEVTTAAQEAGVKRLIWIATAGIYDEIPAADQEEIRAMFGSADDPTTYFGDERVGADIVDASELITTIIRPNTLTDAEEVEPVLVTQRDEEIRGNAISRKTVAHFVSDLILNDNQYLNDSIAISKK